MNALVTVGDAGALSVTATGTPSLSYRWLKDGSTLTNGGRISGATAAVLYIDALNLSDAGTYSVVVSNAFGTASASATVMVVGPSLVPVRTPGVIGFQVPSAAGMTYTLERKVRLTDATWQVVESRAGTGGILQFSRPTTDASSFFRLKVQ